MACGGGFVDCPHCLRLARSASRIRQMVLRLHALLALVAKGRVGTRVQGALRRSRFRICDDRRNDMPGPPTRGRRKRGTQNQAIGRSRGGLTTKIGALVDALGNLIAFVLVPGQRHDVNLVDKLMNGVAGGAFLGDKAFDANKVREFLAHNGAEAVIPPRKGTKGADSYDREKYKWRTFDREFLSQDKGVSPHRHPLRV